jgi:hypothetical protein
MAIDLEKYRKATTTPQEVDLDKYKKADTPIPEKKDGFLKSLAKGVAKLPVRTVSSIVSPTIDRLSGLSSDDVARRNVEGRNLLGMNIKPLGWQASAQERGDMTGGEAILGAAKDLTGAGLEAASYAIPAGKAVPIGKGILSGKVLSTMYQGGKVGLQTGLLQGAGTEMQEDDSTAGSVAKQSLLAGGTGLALGSALGPLAIPGLAKNSKEIMKDGAGSIMQRVARINALDQQKFKQAAGESVGDYLVKRGIYGTDDEIVVKLADRFIKSKTVADDALAKLPGRHTNGVLDDLLEELASREARISTKNVPSRDLATVSDLVAKNKAGGLTMSEVNTAKRLYERNVKLGYLKENNTEAVARATNLDDTLRKWQFAKSKELGFENLDEINRETRLSRQLGDALFKKTSRAEGNNAFGLTDAVLLSGGDPSAITMLLTKKTLGSGRVQSGIAKTIGPKATVGLPEARFTPGSATQSPLQSPPTKSIQSLPSTVPPTAPGTSQLPTGNTKLDAFRKNLPSSEGGYIGDPSRKLPQGNQGVSLSPSVPKLTAEIRTNIVDILDDYTLNGGKNLELQQDAARLAEDLGIPMPKRYGDLVKKLGEILDAAEQPRQVLP